MGYFTETMEALLEFKGDPEKAYYNRRYYERGTHSHEYGKDAHKLGVNAVNTNHHSATPKIGANGNSIIKDRELGDTPSQRMNTYTQTAKRQADSGHKYADHARDLSKKYHESKKSCKESFIEAFESIAM